MNAGPPLGAIARQAFGRFAGRDCLAYRGRRWTFAEVDGIVGALAASLARELARGARVALFMANRPEFVFLQLALERAGLARVPINAKFTAHEVAVLAEDCGAAALFFDSSTADRVSTAIVKVPGIWCCDVDRDESDRGPRWSALLGGQGGGEPADSTAIDDVCSINYTSGTSGAPKGVILTHRNWSAMYRNMLCDRDFRADDVMVHVGPLTHSSGAYLMPFLLRGACNVLPDESNVDGLLAAIVRERATIFTCVPTVLTRVVNHPQIDRFDLGSLRAIGYGAEPIPLNTLEKALQRFGPILTQNYGQTEAMMTVTLLRPDEHFAVGAGGGRELRIGCIGRPYTFVEVVLRSPDGEPVALGEVGEITVRSEHVMAGYWNRPAETAKVLRDGWLWTGDLARRDAEGYVTLAGRSKEMLISGGYNIYPQEVEAVLTSHGEVMEAAVVGVPDPDWGEIAVAYVSTVRTDGVDAETLRRHCKQFLGFKTPRVFRFVESLPKTANGKVDKGSLKTRALAEREVAHD